MSLNRRNASFNLFFLGNRQKIYSRSVGRVGNSFFLFNTLFFLLNNSLNLQQFLGMFQTSTKEIIKKKHYKNISCNTFILILPSAQLIWQTNEQYKFFNELSKKTF